MRDRIDSPLSSAQQRLWFLWQLRPDGTEYAVPMSYRLRGELAVPALRWATEQLVNRHDVLRSRFPAVDGRPELRSDSTAVPWRITDLLGREEELDPVIRDELSTPFDLAAGPVVRAHLIRLDADDHVFILNFHHIVVDGWSLSIITDELRSLYTTGTELPPARHQYAEHVAAEREMLAGQRMAEAVEFWRDQIAGAPESTPLPVDRPHPHSPTFAGDVITFGFPPDVRELVGTVSRRHHGTRFTTLLAAYAALLSRLTSSSDLVIGVPVSGRTTLTTERTVGLFVNMLPIRVRLRPGITFAELLDQVRDTFLACHEFQDLPFQQLVEAFATDRTGNRHPLFQAVFSYQDMATYEFPLPGLKTATMALPSHTAKFELTLHVEWHDDHTTGRLGYQTDVFDADTAALIADRYRTLLNTALSSPDTPVAELPVLSTAEQQRLLSLGNGIALESEPVHVLVRQQAQAQPDVIAVRQADRALTYAELDLAAGRLAAELTPRTIVAICLPRGIDLIVAALAVLKAGATYLPLDPANPVSRLQHIVAESKAVTVIAEDGQFGDVPVISPHSQSPPTHLSTTDAPAYVIYTSGSTGRPKGVIVGHKSLANLAAWHRVEFGLGPGDRTTLVASPGFDASAWEIWSALTAGATIAVPATQTLLAPTDLRDWLVTERITCAFLPTPLAEQVLPLAWPEDTALRRLLTGGDRLRTPPPATTPFTLVNNYGPTECTVVATSGTVTADDRQPPIGRPIPGVQALVLDDELRLVPIGVVGELHLGGDALSLGYLGRPDTTADRFVPNPFGANRLYRTGDLVRLRPDGTLQFLGRNDFQVKIRGLRIELGEIENVLRDHPAVADAMVLAEGSEPTLTACLVLEGEPPDVAELREHVLRLLPRYMLPTHYLAVPAFPLTGNGKLDRRGRPAGWRELAAQSTRSAPTAPLERTIAAVWAEVLGHNAVTTDDTFFELGGHSMLLMTVRDRLSGRLGRPLSIVTLYEHSTITALARHLAQGPDSTARDRSGEAGATRSARAGLARLGSLRAGRRATKE